MGHILFIYFSKSGCNKYAIANLVEQSLLQEISGIYNVYKWGGNANQWPIEGISQG